MFRLLIVPAMVLMISQWAFAAGGMNCKIDDANIKFNFKGVMSHGMPTGPFDTKGSIEFKDQAFKKYNMTDFANVSQFWRESHEIKMKLYKEPNTPVYSTVELVLNLLYNDLDGSNNYQGNYKLYINQSAIDADEEPLLGWVNCSID